MDSIKAYRRKRFEWGPDTEIVLGTHEEILEKVNKRKKEEQERIKERDRKRALNKSH